ncbi:MAG: hypothetical protein LBI36_02780 [Oscillospiraceae bacterium]|jgi:hypothetical protein|nr:hypothetical protein [Oscillospiraceae bacterium]
MRRIVFIVLIVLVVAVTGFFCWREFTVPDITYVADYPDDGLADNHFALKRLYAAVVDEEAFASEVEGLLTMTEFTEDEMMAAALASGTPEFYPVFYYSVYNVGDETRLNGYIKIELAKNQSETRFMLGSVNLEAVAQGFTIDKVEVTPPEKTNKAGKSIISDDKTQMAIVDFNKSGGFEITLGGNSGTMTLRYVYSVAVDTFLNKTVLEDQLLIVHANIGVDDGGNVTVEFTNEPYSSLIDLEGTA